MLLIVSRDTRPLLVDLFLMSIKNKDRAICQMSVINHRSLKSAVFAGVFSRNKDKQVVLKFKQNNFEK